MKAVIFLACVAFAAAVPLWGGYQHKNIYIDEYGKIWVTSQGWKVMVHRPTHQMGHVEVVVTGDEGYHRQVVIDHQFQIVKDSFLGHDYQFDNQFKQYSEVNFWSKYHGSFDQLEHLHSIFGQYTGSVDQQVWHHILYRLFNEVQQGKVHYVIHEIFVNLGQNHAVHQTVQGEFLPNYQWVHNQHYQSIEEHIQHATEMYHLAQRTLAMFEQYGPEHHSYGQGFNYEQHLQYVSDWVHVAQSNLQYLLALQQNPEFVNYGMHNPWYGQHFGEQQQGPWNQHYYGMNSQHQYIQNRIHYIRWQLINFHHKSQEIYHQQQMINDQIAHLQNQFQHQSIQNPQSIDQVRQLYHQLGMLVHHQITLQLCIQQLHHDLDVQVHHWKQLTPYHHEEHQTYQQIQVYPEDHQGYQVYPAYQQYQAHQQPWYQHSMYPSTLSKSWFGGNNYPSTWWNKWWSH